MKNTILTVLFLLVVISVGLLVPRPAIAEGYVPTYTSTATSTPVSTPTPSVTPVSPPTEAAPAAAGIQSIVTPTTQAAANAVATPAPVFEIGWVGYCMIFVIVISWLAIIGFAVYYFYMQSQQSE